MNGQNDAARPITLPVFEFDVGAELASELVPTGAHGASGLDEVSPIGAGRSHLLGRVAGICSFLGRLNGPIDRLFTGEGGGEAQLFCVGGRAARRDRARWGVRRCSLPEEQRHEQGARGDR